MDICFDLTFYKMIKAGDFITYLALVLAYIGFRWTVNRDFESWKSLLTSFKKDLESQNLWLGGEYFEETYKDKNSYSPAKIIYPLSFESLPEIIRRGSDDNVKISENFIGNLSIFNERIVAFNSLLENVKRVVSVNPIITEKLKDKLNDIGLDNDNTDFTTFKKGICELKKEDDVFYLAENIRRLNRVIHVKLIGNRNNEDKLHCLYSKIKKETDFILKNFEKNKPWFIKHYKYCLVFSFLTFFFIEMFLG